MDAKCQLCGEIFDAKRCDAKFCPKCRSIKHREYGRKTDAKRRLVGNCEVCGKSISRKAKRCLSCRFKRERNNFWKGGRHKSFQGYVYIYMPEHPRACKFHNMYVAEHVLVWEKAHGNPLPEGYLIHHLNGVKDDNRPENLVALLPKDHTTGTIREALQKRIRDLEYQLQAPTS